MLRLAVILGLISALLLSGLVGWLIGSRPPPIQQPRATIRQAPADGVLYRDKLLTLYYLCAAGGRFLILDSGPQYQSTYQAGGCAAEVW